MTTGNYNTASARNETIQIRSWLVFFVFFVLLFLLVIYYFSEIKKEFILLEKVNPYWLIAAVAGQFMTYFFTALIYLFLLKLYKIPRLPRRWDLLKASVISLLFNQTVPSAGISGNTFYVNFLSRFNISGTVIISIILGELLVFYAAMEMIIVSLLIACLLVYKSFFAFKATLVAGIIIYLVFGLAVAFAGKKDYLNRLYEKIINTRFIKKIFNNINKEITESTNSEKGIQLLTLLKNNKPIVINIFLFQLLVVAADAFTLYVLFLGLGYPVAAFIVLLALISTKIISIIPFLPGALLLYESSMSFFFATAGVPVGTAIIVTLVYRLLSFWLPMPFGTLLYRKWLVTAPADKIISQS